jgi:hypothetical protein
MPVIPWVCTPLYILFSYTSCQLNSSSSLVSFTEPFWAQKAFGGVEGEARHRPASSHVNLYHVGWGMPTGLCLITSTIHVNLPNTLAISTSLSLKTSHLFTHSAPNASSSGHSLDSPSAGSGGGGGGRLPHPLHLVFVVLQSLLDAFVDPAAGPVSRRLRRRYHRLVAFSQHS